MESFIITPNPLKNLKQKEVKYENIIPIIHSSKNPNCGDCIQMTTYMQFLKAYECMDKDSDISIVVHTFGGPLTYTEAICNIILNHKKSNYKGKFICYIPHYAYSAGVTIAMTCDRIIMCTNSILTPCDAQRSISGVTHSANSIVSTVEYKLEHKEIVSELWLSEYHHTKKMIQRDKAFIDKLVQHGIYTQKVGEKIYEVFFSSIKYCHDQVFSAQEASEFGLNVEIVDDMPDKIKYFVKYLDD
jgi:ClpP class serine protease